MHRPTWLSAIRALLKDARAAIVGVVVIAAASGGRVVLHDHVRVRAWVLIAVGAGVVILVLALEWRRRRAAQHLVRLEGALDESRQKAAPAEIKPRPNAAADETLRLIGALRTTLTRHAKPYGVAGTVDASRDEILRSKDLVARVRVLVGAMDSGTSDLLDHFAQPTQQGPPSVGMLLSGLDHMEAMVTNWGLQDENSISAPSPSGVDVVTTPTHTIMIDQRYSGAGETA